ncbi:MAG: hypothetical protein ACOCXQ_04360 [Patescibacteria group bacterium]
MATHNESKKPPSKGIFAGLENVSLAGKILIFLPILMAINGGLVGGAFGAGAIAVNLHYWKKNIPQKYKIMISIGSLVLAFTGAVLVAILLQLFVF